MVSFDTFEQFVAFFIFDEIQVEELSILHSEVHEPGGVERFADGFSEILVLIFDVIGKEALLQFAFLVFGTHLILILVIFNKMVCMLNIQYFKIANLYEFSKMAQEGAGFYGRVGSTFGRCVL